MACLQHLKDGGVRALDQERSCECSFSLMDGLDL